jgi:hypothetical protein
MPLSGGGGCGQGKSGGAGTGPLGGAEQLGATGSGVEGDKKTMPISPRTFAGASGATGLGRQLPSRAAPGARGTVGAAELSAGDAWVGRSSPAEKSICTAGIANLEFFRQSLAVHHALCEQPSPPPAETGASPHPPR